MSGPSGPSPSGPSKVETRDFDVGLVTGLRRRAMILVSLGELIDGYDLVIVAGALILLKPAFNLTAATVGLVGAVAYLGAFVGMAFVGDLSDKLGRRQIFVINLLAFVGLAILSALVTNVAELMIVRFLMGIAIGADVPTSMAFLNELAPKQTRGRWGGSLPNMMWGVGALIAAFLWVPLLGTGANAWRWAFGLAAIPALIVWIMRQTLPESPRWLVAHGQAERAQEVLHQFGADAEAWTQFRATDSSNASSRSYRELFGNQYGPRTAAVAALFIFNGLSGPISTIATPYILHYIGLISTRNALIFSGLVWVANLLGASSSWYLIDRIGRRRLVVLTQLGAGVCAVAMALFGRGNPGVLVPLFFVFGYLQWVGAIPCQWLWASELFPTRLRGAGQGLTNGINRLAIAASIYIVPVGLAALGFTPLILVFSVLVFAYALLVGSVHFFATNGLPLEEVSP